MTTQADYPALGTYSFVCYLLCVVSQLISVPCWHHSGWLGLGGKESCEPRFGQPRDVRLVGQLAYPSVCWLDLKRCKEWTTIKLNRGCLQLSVDELASGNDLWGVYKHEKRFLAFFNWYCFMGKHPMEGASKRPSGNLSRCGWSWNCNHLVDQAEKPFLFLSWTYLWLISKYLQAT